MTIPKIRQSVFLLLFFTCSCAVSINENGYRFLSEKEISVFRPYSSRVLSQPASYRDSLKIYEITANDIMEITRHNRYTWVILWAPYCSSKSCKIMPGLVSDLQKRYADSRLQIILISTTYRVAELKPALSHMDATCPVFVLRNSVYGEKQRKAFKQLARELDNHSIIAENGYFDNYFFRDTLLINASWNFGERQLDSILSADRGR